MNENENMSRRDALKRMGASTLALAVGTSGVASLLESCADKPKTVEPVAEATDEVKDLEFTRNWTQKMMEAVGEQRTNGAGDAINMREAMRKCSRVCYDKNGFDDIIKEGDFEGFLKTAKDDFGWGISLTPNPSPKGEGNYKGSVLIVHENNTDCLCPMVRACKGKMSTSLCICTETELERMFARAYGGEVKAEVTEAILRGDKSCVYRIELL